MDTRIAAGAIAGAFLAARHSSESASKLDSHIEAVLPTDSSSYSMVLREFELADAPFQVQLARGGTRSSERSRGVAGANVSISLSGASVRSTTTDANGNYSTL